MSVAAIIPTLKDQRCLADKLRLLRQQRPHEISVVDGAGSCSARAASAAGFQGWQKGDIIQGTPAPGLGGALEVAGGQRDAVVDQPPHQRVSPAGAAVPARHWQERTHQREERLLLTVRPGRS